MDRGVGTAFTERVDIVVDDLDDLDLGKGVRSSRRPRANVFHHDRGSVAVNGTGSLKAYAANVRFEPASTSVNGSLGVETGAESDLQLSRRRNRAW